MKYLLSLFFFGLLILACDKNQSPPDGLEVGQTFTVNETRITFAQVEEDSRCPCDVACFWEGVATVRLMAGSDTLRIYTTDNGGFSKSILFEDKTIRLISLLPEPCNGQPDSQDDYRLTVTVE